MTAVTVIKIVFLIIATILALVCVLANRFFPEKNYQNQSYRIRLVVRLRMICFLVMLVLLFIVVVLQ